MGKITPLILSGGVGARLWPVSRPSYPKPFLPLLAGSSLMAHSLARLDDARFAPPVVMASRKSRSALIAALEAARVHPQAIILEPVSRNTAPAIAAGALALADQPGADLILAMPSDLVIADRAAFYDALDRAAPAARDGYMITFGIRPLSAATGYGYIEKGADINNMNNVAAIKRFIEKPDLAAAQKYIESDRFLWNGGIFLFSMDVIRDLFQVFAPQIFKTVKRAWDERVEDSGCLLLGESFTDLPSISFDKAIMEKAADKSAIVPVDMGWRDLGSWRSVWEVADKDQNGNAVIGGGQIRDSRNCLIWNAEGRAISVLGADDLIIIATDDQILVVNKNDAERIGALK